MQRMTGNIGFWLLASLSIAVALYSYRLVAAPWGIFVAIGDGIRAVVMHAPAATLVHALAGATALLLGPLQFIGRLRENRPRLHRWMGRFYGAACLLAGLAAAALARFHGMAAQYCRRLAVHAVLLFRPVGHTTCYLRPASEVA